MQSISIGVFLQFKNAACVVKYFCAHESLPTSHCHKIKYCIIRVQLAKKCSGFKTDFMRSKSLPKMITTEQHIVSDYDGVPDKDHNLSLG